MKKPPEGGFFVSGVPKTASGFDYRFIRPEKPVFSILIK
jgi:hypothetical protein